VFFPVTSTTTVSYTVYPLPPQEMFGIYRGCRRKKPHKKIAVEGVLKEISNKKEVGPNK